MRRDHSTIIGKRISALVLCKNVFWGAFLIGFWFSVLTWTSGEAQAHDVGTGDPLAFAFHVASILLLVVLLEVFLPVKAITPDEWVYKVRPSHRFRLDYRSALTQVVFCASFGSIIGAANGHVVLYSVTAAIARVIPLLTRKVTIPKLLSSGRAKLVTQSSGMILDSDVVQSAITDSQMKWIKRPPTANYLSLVFRRILRQPYLPLLGCEVVLICWSLVHALPVHSIILFIVSWAMLGGTLARCSDFSKLGGSEYPKYWLLAIHSLVAALLIIVMVPGSNWFLVIALTVPTIAWAGQVRSRNRVVNQLTFMDSGVAGEFSPEILAFYLKGLLFPFLASLVLTTYVL